MNASTGFDLASIPHRIHSGPSLGRDVLTKDPKVTAHPSAEKIAKLFELMTCQGVSQASIDRLLVSHIKHA